MSESPVTTVVGDLSRKVTALQALDRVWSNRLQTKATVRRMTCDVVIEDEPAVSITTDDGRRAIVPFSDLYRVRG